MVTAQLKERTRTSGRTDIVGSSTINEATALCPECKAFQTIFLVGQELMNTRKFYQKEGLIYHDCGAKAPCRLYLGV